MGRNDYEAVAREYGRLAARYDERWGFYVAASVRETLRRLPPDAGGSLLDIACGTGTFLRAVTAARPGTAAAGLDISPEMLRVARRRVGADVALLVASADALPFGDATLGSVVTMNAFHFFRTPGAALEEMRRVLRPGGTLVITDWCDDYLTCRVCDRLLRRFSAAHHRVYGSAELHALLAGAGFAPVDVQRYRISWLWGLMTAVARRRSAA